MIAVCLCDPQPVVHEGLRRLLDEHGELELRGACEALEDVPGLVAEFEPRVLIVDRDLGLNPVIDAVAAIRDSHPGTYVVVWAGATPDVESFRILQAGARGIMRKTIAAQDLYECLLAVARGEIWTESLQELDEYARERPRTRPLTPREQEVAALVAKGMKNREIGEALGIATGTVKIHLMHIFEKTGIRDRFELALQGLRLATERDEDPFENSAPLFEEIASGRFDTD